MNTTLDKPRGPWAYHRNLASLLTFHYTFTMFKALCEALHTDFYLTRRTTYFISEEIQTQGKPSQVMLL